MEQLETRQKTLEEEIKSSNDSPIPSVTGSGKRRRITPAVLQVRRMSISTHFIFGSNSMDNLLAHRETF